MFAGSLKLIVSASIIVAIKNFYIHDNLDLQSDEVRIMQRKK